MSIVLRGVFAIVVCLMVTGEALARTPSLRLPPPEFDHAYSGPGEMRVLNVPSYMMQSLCKGTFSRPRYACAYVSKHGCTILMPDRGIFPDHFHDWLLRHERAHCNGWPRTHPRATLYKRPKIQLGKK